MLYRDKIYLSQVRTTWFLGEKQVQNDIHTFFQFSLKINEKTHYLPTKIGKKFEDTVKYT